MEGGAEGEAGGCKGARKVKELESPLKRRETQENFPLKHSSCFFLYHYLAFHIPYVLHLKRVSLFIFPFVKGKTFAKECAAAFTTVCLVCVHACVCARAFASEVDFSLSSHSPTCF